MYKKPTTTVLPKLKNRNVTHPFSLTEFRSLMHNNFLYNLKTGMLQDLVKKIEEQEIITRAGLDLALSEAEKSVKSIDLFLADQLKDNSSIEQELKVVMQMKRRIKGDLDVALKKMGDLKVDLFKKIESIRQTIQCRDFVHSVSSQTWLTDYKSLLSGHKAANQPVMNKLNEEFNNFMVNMGDMDKEVEKIVKEFIDIFQNSGPEHVPFKEGKAISSVIKKMKKNNMEMLVHIRSLQKPLSEERAILQNVNAIFKEEIGEVVRTLNVITGNRTFLKERNGRLESIIHDLLKCMKHQIASADYLKDRALLDSLYKEVVPNSSPERTAFEMWKEIDEAFIEIRCKVGSFSKDEIERRRITINEFNMRHLQEASKARSRVLQMEQMVKGVRKAFWAPALPSSRRPMRPRSQPPPAPAASPPPPSPTGEDYTLELLYQAKLIQPLAINYEIPQPHTFSCSLLTERDCVSPDLHNDACLDQSVIESVDSTSHLELEVPMLPSVDKVKVKDDGDSQQ